MLPRTPDDSSVRGTAYAKTVRQAGWDRAPIRGGDAVIRYVVVLAIGYVLGAKAGRRRYEQIAGTYKAMTGSPAAKAIIDGGRRKIANRVSPDPAMVRLTEI